MKYIYYSLFMFYTKAMKVQQHYPAVINVAGVIAFLQSIFLFIIINSFIFYTTDSRALSYHPVIPFAVAMVLYYFNWKYFNEREDSILKEIKSKSRRFKVAIGWLTMLLICFLFFGHFFNGVYVILWYWLEI